MSIIIVEKKKDYCVRIAVLKKAVSKYRLTSLIRIELTHPPPEGGALSTELQGH